ncbi:MAG: CbiX/SirB N-terminal domain-containing protein [Candidatus Nitrosocaldus sp.]
MMRNGIILIDRGSNDSDVLLELEELCALVKDECACEHVTFALLEVTSPTIEDAFLDSLGYGVEHLTIVPYFLYPGLKMKVAVSKSVKVARELGVEFTVTDCLNYHNQLIELVRARIDEARMMMKKMRSNSSTGNAYIEDEECDVLLIGHGSSDHDARRVFRLIGDRLKQYYRSLGICFLELDEPDIHDGIRIMLEREPKLLILMPYFLHNGEHMKHDIREDIEKALEEFKPSCSVIMAKHLGVDRRIAKVIMERVREAKQVRSRQG